jgi:hypothetical protein
MSCKEGFTCLICSKIYKNPFVLPCGDTICEEHLNESQVLKSNSIKCQSCEEVYEVKHNQIIRPNKELQKLILNERYLNDEEKSLKQQLEQSLRDFLNLNELFQDVKKSFDSDCHNHFQEIRHKIDMQRVELNDQIDKIYMTLIEQTKDMEQKYSKSLNDFKVESFDFDKEQKILNETFRDVNLSAESIKMLQSKQDETIASIKLKVSEINQLKKVLIKSNEFKSNANANVLIDRDSFGQLVSSDPFASEILRPYQVIDLIELCEFNSSDKWTLLYRGSRDGFGASDFHSKCDAHNNTLTILKANGSSFIFGGFTSTNWDGSGQFKSDPNAFVFSLTNNKENQPCKMRQINKTCSIYCHSDIGPIFGSNDIHIGNSANTTASSFSNLGKTYHHPQPSQGNSYLAGAYFFQLSEIEVYQKE